PKAAPVAMGLRAQNKLDKLQRIKAAAKDLFTELGFDAATTRAIARRARVGLGTLFNYADDKRDLVFLIFIEELDRITDRAFGRVDPHRHLLDQLINAFALFYREFGANPTLSRILLRELTFYSHGRLAADFQSSRERTVGFIERLVANAQREQRVRGDVDAGFIALSIFFVYAGAVRWWIADDKPGAKAGIAELKKLLQLHITGLAPAASRAAGAKRKTR
ncbi:MAG: TetR/AcrR family transcriptional regulator, partial [Burkholderiales bacterium]